jgi:hypothetical protein
MEPNKIEKLLEKYWEGETTLAEEKELKAYFNQSEVAAHLKVYQSQFRFFSESAQEKINFSEDFEQAFEDNILADFPKAKVVKMLSKTSQEDNVRPMYPRWIMGVAAGVALLVVGFYAGRNLQLADNKGVITEIKALKTTVDMLAMLKGESASERIKGVSYASDLKGEGSEKAIEALIETLNNDENTNVRLAAANALFIYKDVAKVREALIQSIQVQEDPAIKIALINMMIALKEKKAKKTIEEFIAKEPIPEKIKENIRKELQAL